MAAWVKTLQIFSALFHFFFLSRPARSQILSHYGSTIPSKGFFISKVKHRSHSQHLMKDSKIVKCVSKLAWFQQFSFIIWTNSISV